VSIFVCGDIHSTLDIHKLDTPEQNMKDRKDVMESHI